MSWFQLDGQRVSRWIAQFYTFSIKIHENWSTLMYYCSAAQFNLLQIWKQNNNFIVLMSESARHFYECLARCSTMKQCTKAD